MLPPKYCQSCGEEFMHTAQRCSDCGGELGMEPPVEPEPTSLPPAAELVAAHRGAASFMQELALALQQEGISSRVDRYPPGEPISGAATGSGAALYLLAEDVEAAARILQRRDLEQFDVEAIPAIGTEFEACPACGGEIDATHSACTDCGLEFPSSSVECGRCAGEVAEGDASCRHCGANLSATGT